MLSSLGCLALEALLVLGGAESPTPGTCACAQAIDSDGWCDVHGLGYIGSVEITSARLYETLDAHGHEVDPETFTCATCRRAIELQGFCDVHRVGFLGGQAYFSRLSYLLARAERIDASTIVCATCRGHLGGRGWCEACGMGLVGRIVIRDRASYDEVDRALAIVESAGQTASRCEHCAVAMVTDTTCPYCGIRYEGGKEVERVPPRQVIEP